MCSGAKGTTIRRFQKALTVRENTQFWVTTWLAAVGFVAFAVAGVTVADYRSDPRNLPVSRQNKAIRQYVNNIDSTSPTPVTQ